MTPDPRQPDPETLRAEVERVRADEDFTARAGRLLERDGELLNRLAR